MSSINVVLANYLYGYFMKIGGGASGQAWLVAGIIEIEAREIIYSRGEGEVSNNWWSQR
jgi:hypothetical protein